MLKKNYSKDGRTCRVTFKYPNEKKGSTAVLVGDFNDWNLKAHPMKCLKDGSFSVTISIETNPVIVSGTWWMKKTGETITRLTVISAMDMAVMIR